MRHKAQPIFEVTEAYKDLFDNAHDLIHVLEPDGRILYVNKAWQKNLGYTQEKIAGRLIDEFINPVDLSRFRDYRKEVLSRQTQNMEIIFGLVTHSGSILFVEGFISAKFVAGRPVYTRGIFRDVTQRLHNEAELKTLHEQIRERETNLRQLFFYAPDAIIVIDRESLIGYWNPKAEQIFGWTHQEVIGKQLSQFIIPPQHREAHHAGMKRYLSTGENRVMNKTIEITAVHKSGREFYVALTISSTWQNGQEAFIAFIRDIDEQKRNARELEKNKEQLEDSNRELEQFAHVVSHDLKEPVRKIVMFSDLLRAEMSGTATPRAEMFIDKIESAAGRLFKMVEGVLRNSSLKGAELVPENVDLNPVIHDIQIDLEMIIEEKNAVIHYSSLPTIEGSPVLIYQLFYNLINNSLKFSRPGVGPVIEITSQRVLGETIGDAPADPARWYYEIVVRDNGTGFPQEYADRLFQTFSRLHTKEEYEGTGIGLALCKSIAEKHKGFMRAFGVKNQGATFYIYLPEKQ